MKDIYSFVAKKDNTVVDCDSYLLENQEEAGYMANTILSNYLEVNEEGVNKIEIFKYDNVNFMFIGTIENVTE
ncbi:hypothetical protein [Bacillus thuringiensis]|uniref:hypothetical protein n=1 Tax=Bacillus thuringiensis TaxID=1428 RepID=UPI0037FE1227